MGGFGFPYGVLCISYTMLRLPLNTPYTMIYHYTVELNDQALTHRIEYIGYNRQGGRVYHAMSDTMSSANNCNMGYNNRNAQYCQYRKGTRLYISST